MEIPDGQPQQPEPIDRGRLVIGIGAVLLGVGLCLFVPAGSIAWLRGWLLVFVYVATLTIVTLYLRRVNPEVIAARINRHEGTKRWDRILIRIFMLFEASILIVAALDDGRFHWFPVPWWGCVLGYLLLLAGIAGIAWAESANKFFEPNVRIQTDRGHRVIDTGPYGIIRHPGYASAFLLYLGLPLALGSLWALLPAIVLCLLVVLRTVWEDQTLREELAGYAAYAQRVRFRLIPGIW
jgi:protein-S-isoprenylcysteine O-methyltransferase Ste14